MTNIAAVHSESKNTAKVTFRPLLCLLLRRLFLLLLRLRLFEALYLQLEVAPPLRLLFEASFLFGASLRNEQAPTNYELFEKVADL